LMFEFPRCLRPRKEIPFMLMSLPIYTEFPMSALVDTSIMVEDMSFFYPEGFVDRSRMFFRRGLCKRFP
jgi:hypothetical protein